MSVPRKRYHVKFASFSAEPNCDQIDINDRFSVSPRYYKDSRGKSHKSEEKVCEHSAFKAESSLVHLTGEEDNSTELICDEDDLAWQCSELWRSLENDRKIEHSFGSEPSLVSEVGNSHQNVNEVSCVKNRFSDPRTEAKHLSTRKSNVTELRGDDPCPETALAGDLASLLKFPRGSSGPQPSEHERFKFSSSPAWGNDCFVNSNSICFDQDRLGVSNDYAKSIACHVKPHSSGFPKHDRSLRKSLPYRPASSTSGHFCQPSVDLSTCSPKSLSRPDEPFLINLFIEGRDLHIGPLKYFVHGNMNVGMLKVMVYRDFNIRTQVQKWIIANTLASNDDTALKMFKIMPGAFIFLYVELTEAESQSVFRHVSHTVENSGTMGYREKKVKSPSQSQHSKTVCDSSFEDFSLKKPFKAETNKKSAGNVFGERRASGQSQESEMSFRLSSPAFSDKHCSKDFLPEFKIFKSRSQPKPQTKSQKLVDLIDVVRSSRLAKNKTDDSGGRKMFTCEQLTESCSSDNNSTGYMTASSDSSQCTESSDLYQYLEESSRLVEKPKVMDNLESSLRQMNVQELVAMEADSVVENVADHEEDFVSRRTEVSSVNLQDCEKEIGYDGKKERPSYGILLELEHLNLISNSEPFECSVCLCDIFAGDGVVLRDCLHMFCRDCLSNTVMHCMESFVKCPYRDEFYSCASHLQEREIKALVPPEVFKQYLQRSLNMAESIAKESSFHCKTVDCPGWCFYEDNANIFHCPVCSRYNCLTCQAIHEGLNCLQYQNKLKEKAEISEEAKKTLEFLQKMMDEGKAMKCPTCCITLMKKWGCDWLKCSVCGTEVCWVTKGPRWGPGGFGDTSAGCKCGVGGKKCHPSCVYCH